MTTDTPTAVEGGPSKKAAETVDIDDDMDMENIEADEQEEEAVIV